MDIEMQRNFLASPSARLRLGAGLIALAAHGTGRLLEGELFSQVLGLCWFGFVVFLAWCLVNSFRQPILIITPDGLEFRGLLRRRPVHIERDNIQRVMWQKPSYIRFVTRDGKGFGLNLRSLRTQHRSEIRAFMRNEWGLNDVAI